MSSSAVLGHAARVLAAIEPGLPADAALRRYLANARRLGPSERRAVSRAVFAFFRWRQWLNSRESPPKQIARAGELDQRFQHDPRSVKPEALAALAVPEWLKNEVVLPVESLRQLQREPALWLRARPGTAARLASELRACEPAGSVPDALRYRGEADLFLTPQFHAGAFEIQDLASQVVGHAAGPQPGATWWDACAGEGGKTLHLEDLMQNKGLIWATDRSVRRHQLLQRRAARAKLFNHREAPWDGSARLPTKTRFDGVLIDAPCSGVGTWQRNPHARWTVGPEDVRELAATQTTLLEHAAGAVNTGGRLVYAVCTLTRAETRAVAATFTLAHPEFEPVPCFPTGGPDLPAEIAAEASSGSVLLWPHVLDANGMFIATWRRKP